MTKALLNLGYVAIAAVSASSMPYAAAADEGTASAPLRPMSECLDPQHARGWAIVDGDEIVVDAGRRKFHIRFGATCPELEWTNNLRFRTAGGGNRICGFANEAVIPDARGGMSIPCSIQSITSIDAARYRGLTSDDATAPAASGDTKD